MLDLKYLSTIPATLSLAGFVILLILKYRHRPGAIYKLIIKKVRNNKYAMDKIPSNIKPDELKSLIDHDSQLKKDINEQDYNILLAIINKDHKEPIFLYIIIFLLAISAMGMYNYRLAFPKQTLDDTDRKNLRRAASLSAQAFLETYQCVFMDPGIQILNELCEGSPCEPQKYIDILRTSPSAQPDRMTNTCKIVSNFILSALNQQPYYLNCDTKTFSHDALWSSWWSKYGDKSFVSYKKNEITNMQISLLRLLLWDKIGKNPRGSPMTTEKIIDEWINHLEKEGADLFKKAEHQWLIVRRSCPHCSVEINGYQNIDENWHVFLAAVFESFLKYYSVNNVSFVPGCATTGVKYIRSPKFKWIRANLKEEPFCIIPFCFKADLDERDSDYFVMIKSTEVFAKWFFPESFEENDEFRSNFTLDASVETESKDLISSIENYFDLSRMRDDMSRTGEQANRESISSVRDLSPEIILDLGIIVDASIKNDLISAPPDTK